MTINDLFFIYLLLLIFSLSFVKRTTSIANYVWIRRKIGLNEGTLLLLSNLLKGFLFILLFQIISVNTIYWIIGCSMGVVFLSLYFQRQAQIQIVDHLSKPNQTPLTFFKTRTTSSAYRVLLSIMAFISLFSLLAELTWMTTTLSELFHIPNLLVAIAIIFLVYVYSVMGGYQAVTKASRIFIILIFGLMTCLLLNVYLTNGIKTIYELWTIEQNRLQTAIASTIFAQAVWFFIFLMIYFGYLLTNISLWHLHFSIKANRIKGVYQIASFCLISLALALLFIGVFVQSITLLPLQSLNAVGHALATYSRPIMSLFIAALLAIGLISAMASLKALMDAVFLFLAEIKQPTLSFFKNVHLITLGCLLLLCIGWQPSYAALLYSIQFVAILCITSIASFLLLIISAEKMTLSALMPTIIGALLGLFLLAAHFSPLVILEASFAISLFIQMIRCLCKILLHL